MMKNFLVIALLTVLIPFGFLPTKPAIADLPTGNRQKDPYAILRNALPIEQKELRELQNTLENISEDIRGNRWPSLSKAASKSQFLANNRKKQIIDSIPKKNQQEAQKLVSKLKTSLENLGEEASAKNKANYTSIRRSSLKLIGDLEALLLTDQFPYKIPEEFDALPRLLGRASVEIKTNKGTMIAIIDGYNAPLTGGAFIDLAAKGFYDKLPINRAEEFFILQTGDPKGSDIGYINSDTQEMRTVPLEIRVPGEEKIMYNQTFEEAGLYTSTPVLPFATLGTLGWAHSEQALDDGSSQFFFFLYEAELNPAGRNLIDGRNAAFGYVIEGSEILNTLGVNDEIISIKVLDGSERLKSKA
tara:strand:- start:115 stop:1191 length:1077 start_codon:yes stop_codon:yes gene_type:complete